MAVTSSQTPKAEAPGYRGKGPGWTGLHSWIFLVIVAVGLALLVMQNRYHYLAPPGAGKAYRIDKLFGSMQEFDPSMGWISAQLQTTFPAQASTRMERPPVMPSPQPSLPVPVEGGADQVPPADQQSEPPPKEAIPRESPLSSPITEVPLTAEPSQPTESLATPQPLGREERLAMFKSEFPDYGQEEFELANDDLFPDWQKRFGPTGTWKEFLPVYREFIQWWIASGSPPEPGAKLWKDFLTAKKMR